MAKQLLKRVVPRSLWTYGSNTYWWWYNRGRHQLAKFLDQRWKLNQERLLAYKDKHRGERCFILGNGPSLRDTDLSLIRDEFTFGLNRIYLLFPEINFTTTFLVSVNDLVLGQFAEDFKEVYLPKFFTWRARNWFAADPHVLWVDTDYTGAETFTTNLTERVYEGFTVTYVALQLAFCMGFSEVVLIGVDHNFQTKGPPNTTVTSQGDDPNHFAPDYFGKGAKWQLPDLEGSERAYRLAHQAFEASGRQILDATIGGKLTIFPKVDYYNLFKS